MGLGGVLGLGEIPALGSRRKEDLEGARRRPSRKIKVSQGGSGAFWEWGWEEGELLACINKAGRALDTRVHENKHRNSVLAPILGGDPTRAQKVMTL